MPDVTKRNLLEQFLSYQDRHQEIERNCDPEIFARSVFIFKDALPFFDWVNECLNKACLTFELPCPIEIGAGYKSVRKKQTRFPNKVSLVFSDLWIQMGTLEKPKGTVRSLSQPLYPHCVKISLYRYEKIVVSWAGKAMFSCTYQTLEEKLLEFERAVILTTIKLAMHNDIHESSRKRNPSHNKKIEWGNFYLRDHQKPNFKYVLHIKNENDCDAHMKKQVEAAMWKQLKKLKY